MIEIVEQNLINFASLIPTLITIYVVFDFLGSFFFGKD